MNYYNEFDPKAAAWLRELISAGLIAPGIVDERSITEIQPEELSEYVQCHFFCGIGGWPLAFRLAGIPYDEPAWTGSCPCQPFSAAGAGLGESDERHLWPAFFRLIEACGPRVVYGEQVSSASVIGKVQKVRKGKGEFGIPEAQQGRTPWGVSGMREPRLSGLKTRELTEKEGVSSEETTDAPRICADPRSGEAGEGEGHPVQLGLEEHSGTNRPRRMRSDGTPVRPDDAEVMGCAILGSDNSERRLHAGEYEGGSLLPKHDGEHLGNRDDSEDREGHGEETVIGCVERTIAENRGESEEEAQRVWIDGIRADLGRAHYTVGVSVLAACSVSAPHIRQRAFWVAYAQRDGGRADESRRSAEERTFDGRACGLADADQHHGDGAGLGAGDDGRQLEGANRLRGRWDNFDIIPCRDGKFRRIERGTFPLVQGRAKSAAQPLVDGLPKGVVPSGDPSIQEVQATAEARQMRLRGYGNAIVPELAAEFIIACRESIQDLTPTP